MKLLLQIPLNESTLMIQKLVDIYSIKLKDVWNLDEINIVYLLTELKKNISKFNNSNL